ncbi:phosphotriesterase [Kribbella sandramycini]|uniref:Phosphotriesterase n=1 Tax=Kribbella sandramycini TaxID=60450 RepID=A0A7Y4L1Q4_9ACTN|nr:phosphotriesterase [Kribbella sandramycini]MBB6565387.1 phosphotriesterase-related protein [Kribbella sandramycini]NOL41656.1 phosphotriesterase [Kribbella sandramycini]
MIRTVLGDVDQLGVTDSHDHLFFRSARLAGQELDDEGAALDAVVEFKALGGAAVVQWTPYGLGRRADALVEISRRTGVSLVAATGLHRAEHYPEGAEWPKLAETFHRELTVGIGASTARAGLIKVAGAFHGLDAHARFVLAAAAEAQLATGAPIAVHHELGTAADDVLELLTRLGVPPASVLLGHLNRFPDRRAHLELAKQGAWLAFDGPSRANHATDPWLLDCLGALIDAGYGDRLLLGGDTTTAQARVDGLGMRYLLARLRPRIIREFGAAAADAIFRDNPARAFRWAERGTVPA